MQSAQILDGLWHFAFQSDSIPKPPFQTSELMPVPGCFDLMPPYCGQRGFAIYVKNILASGKVKLSIDGVGLEAEVYMDGQAVASLNDPYMPEDIILNLGTAREHQLAFVIGNHYTERFEPYFDFYGYGGIYGSVTLTELPEHYLDNLRIRTLDYQTGTIKVTATAANAFTGTATLTVNTGQTVQADVIDGRLDTNLHLDNVKTWSPEHPHLYRLTVKTAWDEVSDTFGIRQIRIQGRTLLLNGQPLKLIGVNRHESSPLCGAATPPQMMAYDLRMLKQAGYNFIRGSHYPQRKTFLELCDRMGFLVWEETLGWDVKAPKLHSQDFLKTQLKQAEKLTLAHWNHPSIIIRGFLNENESEKTETRELIQALYDKIRSLNPDGLIGYASNRYEKDVCWNLVDIVAMNPYPGWYDSTYDKLSTVNNVRTRLQELSDFFPTDKPFLITEIGAEALLGFRDQLESYWTEDYQANLLLEVFHYVLEHADCAGVAIWQFADTRSYVNGPHIFGRARGFNNKGIVDEYRRPKLAWNYLRKLLAKTQPSQATCNKPDP